MGTAKQTDQWRVLAEVLGKRTGKPIPPESWWDEHKQMIAEEHPNYTEDQLNRAVGRIWFKIYDDRRREAAIMAEALHDS